MVSYFMVCVSCKCCSVGTQRWCPEDESDISDPLSVNFSTSTRWMSNVYYIHHQSFASKLKYNYFILQECQHDPAFDCLVKIFPNNIVQTFIPKGCILRTLVIPY